MDTETSAMGGFGWLILLFLFLFAFNGNGAWGNGGSSEAGAIYARQASEAAIANSKDIAIQGLQGQIATLNSQYQTLLGFKDSQFQMAQCCCDIKNEVLAENQKTRDLINSLAVTDLRAQLVEAKDNIVTMEQTAALVQALRPYPTPSYVVSSPYTSLYNGYFGY